MTVVFMITRKDWFADDTSRNEQYSETCGVKEETIEIRRVSGTKPKCNPIFSLHREQGSEKIILQNGELDFYSLKRLH